MLLAGELENQMEIERMPEKEEKRGREDMVEVERERKKEGNGWRNEWRARENVVHVAGTEGIG